MKLIKEIIYILETFKSKGYKAYVVGGAVRDYILGLEVKDYDIATNALPEEVMEIFPKVIPTGIDFGTVTLVHEGKSYEITTFRKELAYKNNRKPSKVYYTDSIKEDIKRRDFTMNTLFCDINGQVYDLFGGIEDINNRLIKTIGSPEERFKEDALRMLRAVRFMTTLDFKIEEKTLESIKKNHKYIKNISKERIQIEFNYILLSKKPSIGIDALVETNLMEYIIPELCKTVDFEQHSKYHDKDVYEHTLAVVDSIEPKLHLRLAALLHDIEKPDTFTLDEKNQGHFRGHHIESAEKSEKILKRLRYDNKTIEDVKTLIRYHYLKEISIKEKGVKRFINNVGKERLDDIFKLNIADIKGKATMSSIDKVYNLQKKTADIINRKEPLSKKDLEINGEDIKKLGLTEGKKVGEILDYLLEKVLENPDLNTKETLINLSKEYIS